MELNPTHPPATAFIHGLATPAWTLKPDGAGHLFNAAWLALAGVTQAQAEDAGWVARIHPDDLPTLMDAVSHAKAAASAVPFELRLSTALGWQWIGGLCVPQGDGCACLATGATSTGSGCPEGLQVAKGLLSNILETTPDRFLLYDPQGRYLFANRAALESMKQSAATVTGLTWREAGLPPEVGLSFEQRFQAVLQEGRPVRAELTFPGADPRRLESMLSPIYDDHGGICAVLNIIRDITERQQAEEVLRISEDKYRQLLEQAVDGILLGSPEGVIIGANSMSCEMTEYSGDELTGMHISRLFSRETLEKVPLRFDLLNAGHRVISERELIRKDGTSLLIEMNTKMMPDRTYQAILRDLTDRQRNQAALLESEARYRGLFDSVQEAIYIQDREGRFLDINRGATEMYGRPKEFFIGRTPEVVTAPGMNDLEHVGKLVQRAFEGEPQCFEFWGLRANGETFPKEVRLYKGTSGGQDVVIAMAQDISGRKKAEKALQDSEQHFRELLDRLQEGFAFADTDERFVFANPAASAIFGVPGDLTGRYLKDFVDPEVWQEVGRQTEHRRRGEKGHYDLPIRRPDGETRVLSLSVSPWLSESGEYLGSSGLFQDITERKQAEKALRESETNFRELLDKLGEGFAVVDTEERWTFANQAAARIFGVEPGQLVGHSLREFVDEDTYQDILRQTVRRRLGESSTYEIQIRRLDGELRNISLSASPFLGENGEFLGADGLFLDITERKQAENALRESQERYRELFTNTTDAIFWIRVEADGTFVVESANPTEEAMFGMTNADMAGKTIHELVPVDLADAIVVSYRRCIKAGHPIRYEESADLPSGRKTFQTLLVPIRDADDRVVRLVGFSQDITQAKQAEEALRQAQKLESLGVLAGGIAHDFNNLLTAILGNLNLAQLKSSPESPAQPYLENVERTVLKAAELTKQMLAYSGKGRFVVKAHDLNHVVLEMTHLLNVSISKKVMLKYDLAHELPLIEADAAQIQQVVMNLVTNASEAIGDREGMISIATRQQVLDETQLRSSFAGQTLQPGVYAVLEISDSGSGIPPEIMGKIFDPFFTTKQSGRGLGLSAMQGILRGHHAGIQITSEVEQGSTFCLFFPIAPASAHVKEAHSSGSPEGRFQGRVLLVDDEAEVRQSTEAMLEAIGFQVVTAVDGQDALDRFLAEKDAIDLVLLDLTMPRMDGREAFRELRRIRPDIPVILYSGYSEHESLQETLGQGFSGFLQKPFLMADLRKAIQQVMGRD